MEKLQAYKGLVTAIIANNKKVLGKLAIDTCKTIPGLEISNDGEATHKPPPWSLKPMFPCTVLPLMTTVPPTAAIPAPRPELLFLMMLSSIVTFDSVAKMPPP